MSDPKKILVVEDELGTQKAVAAALKKSGYEVVLADNGKQGMNMVRSEGPDLVVSDVVMPEMDGFAFYRALKTDAIIQDIPVIILTSRGKMEETFNVLGVDCFLTKPFNPETLLSNVDSLLEDDEVKYLKDKKVLLAGGIRFILDELSGMLRQGEAITNIAEEINDIPKKIDSFDPDVLVFELDMEGSSVFEIAKVIQDIPKFIGKPLLVYQFHPEGGRSNDSMIGQMLSKEDQDHQERGFMFMGRYMADTIIGKITRCLANWDRKAEELLD